MKANEFLNEGPVQDLARKLTAAANAYYNTGDTIMSDADYDAAEAQLRALDPDNPYFMNIGSTIRGDKTNLPVKMGSLDQVHEGDLVKWIVKNKLGNVEIVAADKLDGNSILLVYNDAGNLQIAFTRGDGIQGQDVTRHVKQMKSLPLTGVRDIRFVVAEVIMSDEIFNSIVKSLEQETGKLYKNPRNFVAGQMNKKVATPLFYNHIDVIAYGLRDDSIGKSDQYKLLKQNGFKTAGYKVFKGSQISDEMLTKYLEGRHSDSPFALDGIVIDVDNVDVAKKLTVNRGDTSSLNPAFAKKFKVGQADNVATAKVVAVHWKASKNGLLKPRVEIEPVDLVGVTVTYATGFNAKFIVQNKIGPGAEITITRSGDVIPFIKNIVTPAIEPAVPDPSDIGPYSWTPPNANGEKVDFVLDDIDSNTNVQLQRLIDFFRSMAVEFISLRGLEKLFNAGYTTPESIITAKVQDVQRLVGDANGRKGMQSITAKLTNVKPWVLAGSHPAYGRGIGKRKLKKVFDYHGSVHGLTLSQLVEVPGIEATSAKSIMASEAAYKEFLKAIDGFYSLDTEVEVKPTTGELIGEYIVFTGVRDAALQAELEKAGAEVGSSKSKMTILIAKDPNAGSSKLKQAADKGVKVISVADGWALVK